MIKTFFAFLLTLVLIITTACSVIQAQTLVQAQTQPEQVYTSPLSQDPLSLTVSPPVSYLHVKPGETLNHTITLKNSGQQTLAVTMSLRDFTTDGQTGQIIIGQGSIFDKMLNPDLGFGQEFTLKPQENRTVTLKMDIASQAQEKEYPLTVLFAARLLPGDEGSKTPQPAQSSTKVSGTVASNLILLIAQDQVNQGQLEIAQLKTVKFVDSFAPIKFSVLVKNSGLNAQPVLGQAQITNFLGQTINEYFFYPDMILADSTRQIRGVQADPKLLNEQNQLDPEKITNLDTNFTYQAPFFIGPYQIQVNLDNDQETVTVIALPFSLIILSMIGFSLYWGYQKLQKYHK